jgi:hypothetical protein
MQHDRACASSLNCFRVPLLFYGVVRYAHRSSAKCANLMRPRKFVNASVSPSDAE